MRYEKIDARLFVDNRAKFIAQMTPNSIAVLTSNDIMPTNADDVMGFRQNNSLFYLTGVDQEETILILYPDAAKSEFKEILFVRETNDLIKVWEGEKLTKDQATVVSGIEHVEWNDQFERILQMITFEADKIYLGHNEHIKRVTAEMKTKEDRLIDWCKEKYPLHEYGRAAKILRDLRPVKHDIEAGIIRQACTITAKAFHKVLDFVKPGVKEFEIEAEITGEFVRNGSKKHAYLPIIGSGKNACALHYVQNDAVCEDGDLILMDFGCEYANYASDITRCVPVNGIFSPRQKQVYEAVLRCLKEGSKLLKPGILHADYEKEMAKLVENEIVNLGLISKEDIANQDPKTPAYKKYFMHGTAHHMGLDTHDVGLYSRRLEAGMVLTCEPGIYIPEEGIGCRLENDYLITSSGNENLTSAAPIEIEEIERLMKK